MVKLMICKIPECDKHVKARGWCNKHWLRWYKYGDPLFSLRASPGSGTVKPDGYKTFLIHGRYVREHLLIAEKALGRRLPKGAQVHHINGIRDDNRPENLVVCPDGKYHQLLHVRQRALDVCGDASWRRCAYCKQYDSLDALSHHGQRCYHNSCANKYNRDFKKKQRELIHEQQRKTV